jgi:hypothetical protein
MTGVKAAHRCDRGDRVLFAGHIPSRDEILQCAQETRRLRPAKPAGF